MLEKVIFVWAISALLFVLFNACSNLENSRKQILVPTVVEKAFNTKYSPDISRTWQKHYYGYEAVFIQNNIKYEAEFSANGEWLETEYYVSEKEFPEAVLQKIKKQRPNFVITKYEIEITPKGIFYEVDITDGEIEEELYFDEKGNPAPDLYED
ncbi:hypothetical protein DSM106972_082030 [Dulcicalothrix desertica PCC 7102]|uniref:Putative beta-lactamase-inhibitor-like PepSY-like domain-containing protein n=1 Tax=Dulcicalothrix desertica PCC 7102 TaxID=232991 RepID=A0A3S1C6U0_9CYAN|nr:PepSY-like domain-containing protein [Dulcicalothrix desertica]RUS97984.1 hypothetical protein DSM106972_082030 [Dulcicalothrix desertica PCC 7102]TWH54474.1 putative PepSY-like beta-lactamase-inhibitor [Dulcicalothrix desertica PCC 7102]